GKDVDQGFGKDVDQGFGKDQTIGKPGYGQRWGKPGYTQGFGKEPNPVTPGQFDQDLVYVTGSECVMLVTQGVGKHVGK
ncbi:hypothetical protein SAMN02745121_08710, partial [Nannocystis exedens]